MNSYYKKWVYRSTSGVITFMAGIAGVLTFSLMLHQKAELITLVASALAGVAGTTGGLVLFGNAVLQRVRYERSKSHPKRSHRSTAVEFTES